VGSDSAVWRGNPLELAVRLNGAATDAEATARVEDLRFALDTVLAGERAARIDAERIIAAGHSYGANTAVLAAGAEVPRGGRVVRLRDERVRAAMLISTPPFYGESDWRRILAPVRVPTLHVTSTGDRIRIPGLGSGPEDRLALYEATGSPAKWLAVFEGGTHGMFTGRQLDPAVRTALQDLALAFTQQVFGAGGPGGAGAAGTALAQWPRRHAAVLARFEAAV
jgi:dienelactone hydrolase